MTGKPVPIGIESYKEIIDKDYYYVDKTLLIRDLLDKRGKVNLFTRPRRFGKTLALSMIQTFFEKETDKAGNVVDNSRYFKDMKIMRSGRGYREHQGIYPVISLSFKSAKQPDFEMSYHMLTELLASEYRRHKALLEADGLLEAERKKYEDIMQQKSGRAEYATSLKFLSDCLKRCYGKNVIILLDEYDVPLENAYFCGYYDEMSGFLRSLFESALKTNDSLEFAVITGCLRISKESIFTGLNNLKIISVLDNSYAEYFGFTLAEVRQMMEAFDITDRLDEVRRWYDGYLFGETEVYNPWSVINYVDTAISNTISYPKPYWSNTSSNSIVRDLVEKADAGTRKEIEELIAGGTIEKPIHEDVTYEDIYSSQDNIWNFLYFTGYLKAEGQRFDTDSIYLTLKIPNEEIRYIYRSTIREWFRQKTKSADLTPFYYAVQSGDCNKLADFISEQLAGSISYYDNAESFYHGYLIGLFSGMDGYETVSNRESGDGRPDIVLSPLNPRKAAIIIEIKRAVRFSQMDELCDAALIQIEEKKYDMVLHNEGYDTIIKYGFCFCKKSCRVKKGVKPDLDMK